MDDLYLSLEDLYLINECVEAGIELLATKLPTENKLDLRGGVHVYNNSDELPDELVNELETEDNLQKLIELHERINVMIEEFENEELEELKNNNEEEVEMKNLKDVINGFVGRIVGEFYNKEKDVHAAEFNHVDADGDVMMEEMENEFECCENCQYCNEPEEEVHEEGMFDDIIEEIENATVEEVQEMFIDPTNIADVREVDECCGNCENCQCCHEPEEEVHECCGDCENCQCCHEQENQDNLGFVVETTMECVVGELEILKAFLCKEMHCDKCGGHKLVEMSDVHFKLLEVVGYGENVCHCDEEACDEEKVEFMPDAAENNEAPVQGCVDENAREAFRQFKADHMMYNEVEVEFNHQEWERDAANFCRNQELEEATQYVLNKPVEIIWACAEGVEPPTKNEEDMGFDVRAYFEEDYMMFKPHETKLVPTGLYAAVPILWGLLAREKGSTGAIGMKCGSGVIDSGYRGEIFIAITNENDCHLVITKDPDVKKAQRVEWVDWENGTCFDAILYPYKKGICQLLVKFSPKVETKVVTIDELKAIPSLRGEGKLGSTDNF